VLNISDFQYFNFFTCHKIVCYVVKMWRENDNDFIANFLLNPKVKLFLKLSNIWQNYD